MNIQIKLLRYFIFLLTIMNILPPPNIERQQGKVKKKKKKNILLDENKCGLHLGGILRTLDMLGYLAYNIKK